MDQQGDQHPDPNEPSSMESDLDNAFGRFPSHMGLVANVFEFSHAEANLVSERFQNISDLLGILEQSRAAIRASNLPDEQKITIIDLLHEEADVILFSLTSRSSVVAI